MIGTSRVTYREEGAKRSRTMYLKNPVEVRFMGALALMGAEVDREQAPLHRNHIVQLELVTKRTPVVMSKFYGRLEAE